MLKASFKFTRSSRLTPRVLTSNFKRGYAKTNQPGSYDMSTVELTRDVMKDIRASRSTILETLNLQAKKHSLISNDSWLDVFHKDNSGSQVERINEIKQSFSKYTTDKESLKTLFPGLYSSFQSELENLGESNGESLKELVSKITKLNMSLRQTIVEQIFDDIEYFNQKDEEPKEVKAELSSEAQTFVKLLNEIGGTDANEPQDSKIKELVQVYTDLPTPRFSNLGPEVISKFASIIQDNVNMHECFKVAGEVMKDIQETKYKLTSAHMYIWTNDLVKKSICNDDKTRSVQESISSLKETLAPWKSELDIQIYNQILMYCLQSGYIADFEALIKEIQSKHDTLTPNRSTIMWMSIYAAYNNNLNGFLNILLDFRIKSNSGYNYYINPYEYELYFKLLNDLKQRPLAKYIFQQIIKIRKEYRALHNIPSEYTELETSENNTPKAYDNVAQNQQIVQFYPQLTPSMLLPFYESLENLDELKQLNEVMVDNKLPFGDESISNIVKFLNENKKDVSLETFRNVMKNVIWTITGTGETRQIGVTFLMFNKESLKMFHNVAWYLLQKGSIDGKDKTIMEAFKIIEDALEKHESCMSNDDNVSKLSVAIMRLSLKL
ncbi:unnamed protein product [Ambrosiozyma monospora]|uniref:Unnamed protein product n=1 Tax=Ambrosiozyma monospora TaxID=43982 RepID=A0A9W6YWM3_AMBMO|nr:unnamed protein product [Ambrosiozyma monospora]